MQAKITAITGITLGESGGNHYLNGFWKPSDEWIRSRTGIVERRFSAENEYTSDLSIGAVKEPW